MQHRLALPAALILSLVSAACGYDSNGTYGPNPGPDSSSVVGSYEATFITNTVDGKTTDLIAFGLEYSLTLKADHTMTARYLLTTGTPEPGNALDVTGTWREDPDSSITVVDNNNTFLSGIVFRRREELLDGIKIRESSILRLVLERRREG